jgi:hypothetical protein
LKNTADVANAIAQPKLQAEAAKRA